MPISNTPQSMLQFIQHAVSPYHTVQSSMQALETAHFSPLVWGMP